MRSQWDYIINGEIMSKFTLYDLGDELTKYKGQLNNSPEIPRLDAFITWLEGLSNIYRDYQVKKDIEEITRDNTLTKEKLDALENFRYEVNKSVEVALGGIYDITADNAKSDETFTLKNLYDRLASYSEICVDSFTKAEKANLDAVIKSFEGLLANFKNYSVKNSVKDITSANTLTKEKLAALERFRDEVNKSIEVALGGVDECTTEGKKKWCISPKFFDLLPIIIALTVLVVGLSLGLTIFNKSQDAWYFALESIKDIIGSAASYLFIKQCVNHKRKKENNVAIVISSSICGLVALMFSIVLWVGSNVSLIERFTQWGKLAYLWMGLTIILIEIICAVSIVWFLLTHHPKVKDDISEDDL